MITRKDASDKMNKRKMIACFNEMCDMCKVDKGKFALHYSKMQGVNRRYSAVVRNTDNISCVVLYVEKDDIYIVWGVANQRSVYNVSATQVAQTLRNGDRAFHKKTGYLNQPRELIRVYPSQELKSFLTDLTQF